MTKPSEWAMGEAKKVLDEVLCSQIAHDSSPVVLIGCVAEALNRARNEGYEKGKAEHKTADSYFERLKRVTREAALEEAAGYLDWLVKEPYSESLFPAPTETERAKDGKAADVLRRTLPGFAEKIRNLKGQDK